MQGILGRKIGMTQVFDESGELVPVTVLRAGPCVVTQVKTDENDGYRAVQIGLLEAFSPRKHNKAMQGHAKKAGAPSVRVMREFGLEEGEPDPTPGSALKCDIFNAGELVDVVGTSKGKGFAGVMKRHGFGGGPATHGSMFHRSPGAVGMAATPSRVMPGMRMAGQMGNKRTTVTRLEIVKVDAENHMILVKGSVPGSRNGLILIRRSIRQNKEAAHA